LAAVVGAHSPERQPSILVSIAALSIIGGVLFAFAAQIAGSPADSLQFQQLPFYLWAFIPGMLVATIEADHPEVLGQLRNRRWLGLAVLLLVVGGLLDLNVPFLVDGRDAVPTSIGAAILVGAAIRQNLGRFTRPAIVCGALSYAFYLWHVDVIGLLDDVSLIGAMEAFGVTAVIAALSYVLVERTALRVALSIEVRVQTAAKKGVIASRDYLPARVGEASSAGDQT
jgi:peptidoglycan/LPS O-acetylase OafA/YrhL